MSPTLRFVALGKPQPKGAHTSFVPKRGDGSYVTRWDGKPVVVTKDTNDKQEAAQRDLALAAMEARTCAGWGVLDGPVALEISYFFARNKGHYGTGRNAGLLKDSAPAHPVTAADVDKLERLVLDSLTGTLLRDDKLVVRCTHAKCYAEGDDPPRIEVAVTPIEPETVGKQVADFQLAMAA